MDEALTGLVVELKERGIYDCVNIIIVSDHGETILNLHCMYEHMYIACVQQCMHQDTGHIITLDAHVQEGYSTCLVCVCVCLLPLYRQHPSFLG